LDDLPIIRRCLPADRAAAPELIDFEKELD
jgi:hypothetical protein